MKIQPLPKEVLAEILWYLADYERFQGLEQTLQGGISIVDVRSALRELSVQLREDLTKEQQAIGAVDSSKIENLNSHTRKILSSLSPREEKTLLRIFGLLEDN